MDRGVTLEAAVVDEMRQEMRQMRSDLEVLRSAEERRKVGDSLESLSFPDSMGSLMLSPACCEELTGVLASFDAEQRAPLVAALSHLRMVPKTLDGKLGGHAGGAILTAADMAVIQESARLKKRPVEDVQRDFMAARERQIAEGRYRAR